MKTVILYLLLATYCVAGDYTVIFLDDRIQGDALTQTLENVKDIGVDPAIIDSSSMPVWFEKADTNVTGNVICVRTDGLGVKGWKDLPLPQVETRISKDVPPPEKQWIKVMSRDDLIADYETESVQP